MKIRVVMPYYNGSQFIKEQLDSLVNQEIATNWNYEIFIYDDKSSPEEAKFLHSLLRKKEYVDKNIKLITNNDNKGVTFTAFKGMGEASLSEVEYLFFSDQDDIWDKTKILKQINHIQETNFVFSFHKHAAWENNKLIVDNGIAFVAHAMCMNLKLFNFVTNIDYEIFLNFLTSTIDVRDWADLLCHDGLIYNFILQFKYLTFGHLDEPLVKHRVHRDSMTNSKEVPHYIRKPLLGQRFNISKFYLKPLFTISFERKFKMSQYYIYLASFSKNLLIHNLIFCYFWICGSLHLRFLFDLPFRVIYFLKSR